MGDRAQPAPWEEVEGPGRTLGTVLRDLGMNRKTGVRVEGKMVREPLH